MSTFTDLATGLDTVYALQPLGNRRSGVPVHFLTASLYMLTQVAIPLSSV